VFAVPDEYAHLPAPATPAGDEETAGIAYERGTRASTSRDRKKEERSRSIVSNRSASALTSAGTVSRTGYVCIERYPSADVIPKTLREIESLDVDATVCDTPLVPRASWTRWTRYKGRNVCSSEPTTELIPLDKHCVCHRRNPIVTTIVYPRYSSGIREFRS